MSKDFILEMMDISKAFPGVMALDQVKLKVRRRTVHALMGENGAGKSTLMKILIGIYRMDKGQIKFDGEKLNITSTTYALKKGISMIFQELNPIPHMTVAENIYVGREPLGRAGFVNKKKMIDDTQKLLHRLALDKINPHEKVANLSVAKTQMVEIAKAISYNSKLIIMDEPTSAITEKECDQLFNIVCALRDEGVSFIFITHKIDEVFKIADEVSVMRDGKFVGCEPIKILTKDKLVEMMVGREIKQMFPKEKVQIGEVILSLKDLSITGLFKDISLDVRKGEIFGLAGLMGAGRTEVMEAVFGYRRLQEGEIYINGKKTNIGSPADAIRNKIAFITEDRKLTGCYLPLTVKDNMIMPSLGRYKKGLFLDHKKINQVCDEEKSRFNIKTPSLKQIINNLSGGNQQKVLVSRWLLTEPDIIILDEPTRGIDVGTKVEIHKIMTKLAQQGKAIIMISSELPEILGMSDRIGVMYAGRLTGIHNASDADQKLIMQYATGIEDSFE